MTPRGKNAKNLKAEDFLGTLEAFKKGRKERKQESEDMLFAKMVVLFPPTEKEVKV